MDRAPSHERAPEPVPCRGTAGNSAAGARGGVCATSIVSELRGQVLMECSIRPDSSRLDGREAGDVNAHPALRRGSAEGADRASGELHVLGQIGLGHVRVVLIKALHDARCKRRRKLGAKLTEESRGPHEHETTERP